MAKDYRPDIKLRLTNKDGIKGALNKDDLKHLFDFIDAVSSQNESLSNLSLVGIGIGSTEAALAAVPVPGGLSLYTHTDRTRAIMEIFDQPRSRKKVAYDFPGRVSEALRSWTNTGVGVEISYRNKPGGRLKKLPIDPKRLEQATPRPLKAIVKDWIVGSIRRLSKERDEKIFGIETSNGILLCPMDDTKEGQLLDLYAGDAVVDVLASFPPKPQSGTWKAKKIHLIIPRVQPTPLINDTEADMELALGQMPKVDAPKHPQPFDVAISAFAAALNPEDADSLSDFLEEYRAQ